MTEEHPKNVTLSGHVCHAGVNKLHVMYDGTIIPCAAFKGALEKHPELNLGNTRNTTLAEAMEKAKEIEWLTCFQESRRLTVDDYMQLPYLVDLTKEEDGGFSTKVPDLPGCFSQGDTAEEAVENTKEAMRNWITATLEKGKEGVPLPSEGHENSAFIGV